MAQKRFIIEVEKAKEASEGRPSRGPVYRSLIAKDGFPAPIQGLDSCWDVFRLSVEKYPTSPMLGRREIVDGKAGKYKWLTYKEVYDLVIKIGNSIRSCGYHDRLNLTRKIHALKIERLNHDQGTANVVCDAGRSPKREGSRRRCPTGTPQETPSFSGDSQVSIKPLSFF
ncbi:long chain acyl-CoA synthetase 4 [Cajanus cajan]|uniref:long chain acyl-CoA synthetase 4 n=1 Tax=Cajanus cajan TaxID=3821 RepID=UPI0010FADCCE|nr:long chain acyl-CoA synthetase 4 [Cajanus cajan]